MSEPQPKRRRTLGPLPSESHSSNCPAANLPPPYVSGDGLFVEHPQHDPAAGDNGYSHARGSAIVVQPAVLEPGFGFYKDSDDNVWEFFDCKWWLRVHASQGTFAWESWDAPEPRISLELGTPPVLGPGFWKDCNHCIWQMFRAKWWHRKRDSTGACEWIRWPVTSQFI